VLHGLREQVRSTEALSRGRACACAGEASEVSSKHHRYHRMNGTNTRVSEKQTLPFMRTREPSDSKHIYVVASCLARRGQRKGKRIGVSHSLEVVASEAVHLCLKRLAALRPHRGEAVGVCGRVRKWKSKIEHASRVHGA
jgi:hypothetical protein